MTVSGSRGTPTVPAGGRGLQGLMMTSLGLLPWSGPGTGEENVSPFATCVVTSVSKMRRS